MNANQIFSMISRLVLRKLVHRGVDAGINRALGPGKPKQDQTPQERAQSARARETAKRARKAARVTRKLGKF